MAGLPAPAAVGAEDLAACCGCKAWAAAVAARGPFAGGSALLAAARAVWWGEVGVAGWLEALAAHPRIGDVESLRERYGQQFGAHSEGEQQGVAGASDEVLHALKAMNEAYEAKFGHLFVICAQGKSAAEMLAAVRGRLGNAPREELGIAAVEQMKITELRLAKQYPALFADIKLEAAGRRAGAVQQHVAGLRSPITTHILDIALGRPAAHVAVRLERLAPGSTDAWELLAVGKTNSDGRVPDLLEPADWVAAGTYRIGFDTAGYYAAGGPQGATTFYPHAQIVFEILGGQERQHFHVPLLLSPFGYSTYRGS